MLLVCFICFCPTDEQMSVLAYDKGKPELLLRIIFCVYLLLFASLRLLYLRVTQILYSMHAYLYMMFSLHLLLKFLLTRLTIQHSVWHLWLLQSPHCQIPEMTNSPANTCVYFVLWLAQLFQLRTKNWTSPHSTRLWCSLVPGPRPAFRHLQYGKAFPSASEGKLGGAWERG